jgi:hypothetical protein
MPLSPNTILNTPMFSILSQQAFPMAQVKITPSGANKVRLRQTDAKFHLDWWQMPELTGDE